MCKKKKLFKFNLKTILKITIMILLTFFLIWSFNNSYAGDMEGKDVGDAIIESIVGHINGILGFFMWIPGLIGGILLVIVPYLILSLLFALIGSRSFFITPADIFYNRIPLLSIDFFDFSGEASDILMIRATVAKWFVVLSGVALAFLLAVLIYIAIRAVVASTGSSKAKYQKMFVNWLVSVGLLGILGLIIVASISLNNAFVRIIERVSIAALEGKDFGLIIAELMGKVVKPFDLIGQFGSMVLLGIITLQTFKYAFVYIRRMIKIAFLIMIAPLITITYSIDKIADNKSQALNTWMHTFMFNVFIQTFHALIFSVFFILSFKVIVTATGTNFFGGFTAKVPGVILAIMSLNFISEGEKIIKQIFGISGSEELPAGGKLLQFALVKTAIDATSKKLEKTREKQEAPRFFEGTINKGEDQSGQRDSSLPQQRQRDDTQGQDAPIPLSTQEAENPLAQSLGSDFDLEDLEREITPKRSKGNRKTFEGTKNLRNTENITGFRKYLPKKLMLASATLGSATIGVASGDLMSAWGAFGSLRNVGRMGDHYIHKKLEVKEKRNKRSKKDVYMDNTKAAAVEARDTFMLNRMVNNESLDIGTNEQISEMQKWFRTLQDKSNSGHLLDDYKKSRENLIKKLQSEKGVTRARATTMTLDLQNAITSGNIPTEDTELGQIYHTREGKDLASSALERKQVEDMEKYNGLESDIRGVTYNYNTVKQLLNNPEFLEDLNENQVSLQASASSSTTPTRDQASAPSPTTPRRDQSQTTHTDNDEGQRPAPTGRQADGSGEGSSSDGATSNQNERQIDYYRSLIGDLEEKIKRQESEHKALLKQNTDLDEKRNKTEEKLKKAEEEKNKSEVKRLRSELRKSEADLRDINIKINDFNSEIGNLKQEQTRLNEVIEEIKDEDNSTKPKPTKPKPNKTKGDKPNKTDDEK